MFIGKNSFSLLISLWCLKYFNAKMYCVVCAVGKSIIKLSIYGNHIYLKKKKLNRHKWGGWLFSDLDDAESNWFYSFKWNEAKSVQIKSHSFKLQNF